MYNFKLSFSSQGLDAKAGNEVKAGRDTDIKVEEHAQDSSANTAGSQHRLSAVVQPQHHRDIRTVLVKEESPPLFSEVMASQANKHIQWDRECAASSCKCCFMTLSQLGKQGLFIGQDGYISVVLAAHIGAKFILSGAF